MMKEMKLMHPKQVQDAFDYFMKSELTYTTGMVGYTNREVWSILVKILGMKENDWLITVPPYLELYQDESIEDDGVELLASAQDAFLRSKFYLYYKYLHPELSEECIEQSIFYDYWSKKLSDVFVGYKGNADVKHLWLN